MYLLDTDIVSNLLKPTPSTSLVNRLTHVPTVHQNTSSITLGEVLYGSYLLGPRGAALRARAEATVLANMPVLPFDQPAAHVYAEVRAHLESEGTPIGDADTRIAAIAIANDLTLVTGNTHHFERVPGLRLANWLA